MTDEDDIFIDDIMDDFAVPPRYGRRHTLQAHAAACGAKPGREEVGLVMKVYGVGQEEAKRILKEKAVRRREALEKRRAEEDGEERPVPPRHRRRRL